MTIREQMRAFAERWGREVVVGGVSWRYYRLGAGSPLLWLTGGLRRAALGFAFLERIAARHTVIAPDYPPVRTAAEFSAAFDAIRQAEGVGAVALLGQSYGGLLAQVYLAQRPQAVERLILSSTGPADYGRVWLPVEYVSGALARILPERTLKKALAGGLLRVAGLPEAGHAAWQEAIWDVLDRDLSRRDVISHFQVAADWIGRGIVTPAAYRRWAGPVSVLRAANDPTQGQKDIPQYERLFGRPVRVVDMGAMGHAAVLFDAGRYVELLEGELA